MTGVLTCALPIYRGAAFALGAEVNNGASRQYAVEGQSFVLAPCAVIDQAAINLFCDSPVKEQLLLPGGGFATIYGPDGQELTEPLAETVEGLLYADLDLARIALAKNAADPVGHYARPDVTTLLWDRSPRQAVSQTTLPAYAASIDEATVEPSTITA